MPTKINLALKLLGLSLLTACVAPSQPQQDPADTNNFLRRMSDDDLILANKTVQTALETALSGQTLNWRNSSNGHQGNITPRRTYKAKAGYYCRVYSETLVLEGVSQRIDGTACRNRNGVWQPIKQ